MTLNASGVGLCLAGGRRVLSRVNLSVAAGELVVLLGPNGTGKSTLLRALAGLLPPSEGEITLDGTPLRALKPRERARAVAYLPQTSTLDFDFTVRAAVAMGRYAHGDEDAASGHDAVARALSDVDLTPFAQREVTQLSGGERQRAWLARLIASAAPLWLLDEPTTALDARHAFGFLERCRSHVSAGGAVVVALHDLDVADRLARTAGGRVVVLYEGTVDVDDSPDVALTEARIARVFGVASVRHPHGLSLRPNHTR